MTLDPHRPELLATAIVVAAIALLAATRARSLPVFTRILAAVGVACLALAALAPTLERPRPPRVVVLVDVSPSTRIADFRDPSRLLDRLDALLGATSREVRYVADGLVPPPWVAEGRLGDVASARTTLPSVADADAVLLLGDGQFAAASVEPGVPVFAAVDAALDDPRDAAIESLELRGRELVAVVANAGAERSVRLTPLGSRSPVPAGRSAVSLGDVSSLAPGVEVVASLDPADAWPENDTLALRLPPREAAERWWVGDDPPAGFVPVDTAALPRDAAEYLGVSLVVLSTVPGDAIAGDAALALSRFVRDLGGGLLVIDTAAEGLAALDAILPLSPLPPTPAERWVVLLDASGSMATPAAGRTRWDFALDAARRVLATSREDQVVRVGSFAGDVRWWTSDVPAADARTLPLPPGDLSPRGPTNLDAALRASLEIADAGTPTSVLLISDADAAVGDPEATSSALRARSVTLHLLATRDDVPADVASLVAATGGRVLRSTDPLEWSRDAARLLRDATTRPILRERRTLAWTMPSLAIREVEMLPRRWLREGVAPLASAGEAPVAASWPVGLGRATATAVPLTADELAALVELTASSSSDPRLRVEWSLRDPLRVTLHARRAIDVSAPPWNRLSPTLHLRRDSDAATLPLRQVAPGRYEATFEPSRRPSLATLQVEGRVVDRRALPGRYDMEFSRIGTDRERLRDLAARTGGAVVEPGDLSRLPLPHPTRRVPLQTPLAVAGVVLLSGALLWWRSLG
jgi:hypothetical protein